MTAAHYPVYNSTKVQLRWQIFMNLASEAFILLFQASTVTPGGAKCFLSSFLLHYLSPLSVTKDTAAALTTFLHQQQQGLSGGELLCVAIVLPSPSPAPPGLDLYSSPALQPSVPHQWLDTSTLTQTPQEPPGEDRHICAVVFLHLITQMFKVGSYLQSVSCTAAVLVLGYLCEHSQTECFSPIHILRSHRLSEQQQQNSRIWYFPSVCGARSTLQKRFFFFYTSLYTWKLHSNCESSEFKVRWWEATAAEIRCWVFKKAFFRGTKKIKQIKSRLRILLTFQLTDQIHCMTSDSRVARALR